MLFCVGGPAHGQTVEDVGAYLHVPVYEEPCVQIYKQKHHSMGFKHASYRVFGFVTNGWRYHRVFGFVTIGWRYRRVYTCLSEKETLYYLKTGDLPK